MARIVARNASLYLTDSTSACRAMGGFTNSITLSNTAEAPEVTSFGEPTRTRVADGLKDWELTADVFFATGANETDVVLSGLVGASTLFSLGPSGSTSGSTKYTAQGVLTNYEMSFGVADAATASITVTAMSGSLTRTTW